MKEPTTYFGRFFLHLRNALAIIAIVWFFEYVYSASLANGAARQEVRR